VSLLDRFLARIAPINIGDGTLTAIVTAITAPGEIIDTLARESDTHAPWGKALDPDDAPAPVLPWLALLPGVKLQPGDTEAQQRYRIRQAAGLYRCTPRAIVEELQLVLLDASTKTVLLGFHTPDQWHYTIGTLTSETPDPDAVARAVDAQNPVGMIATVVSTDDWTWFVLAPDLVAHREVLDGVDSYVIGTSEYPTWQSVIDAFSTWQHLIDNDPDL
jgi:hypothetical protein